MMLYGFLGHGDIGYAVGLLNKYVGAMDGRFSTPHKRQFFDQGVGSVLNMVIELQTVEPELHFALGEEGFTQLSDVARELKKKYGLS